MCTINIHTYTHTMYTHNVYTHTHTYIHINTHTHILHQWNTWHTNVPVVPGPAELCRCPVLVTMGATACGSGGDFSAGSVDGTGGDKDGGVRTDGTQSEEGGEGSSPVVTYSGKNIKVQMMFFLQSTGFCNSMGPNLRPMCSTSAHFQPDHSPWFWSERTWGCPALSSWPQFSALAQRLGSVLGQASCLTAAPRTIDSQTENVWWDKVALVQQG